MAITINDIKIGTLYNFPSHCSPYNEPCKVTKIIHNPRAGRPVHDLWGEEVWREPAYSVDGIGLNTGEERGFTIQSDDQDLTGFIALLQDPQH